MKNIFEIARLTLKMGLGLTFIIFGIISALFVFSCVLYFVMPQLNRFNLESPAVNAAAMGVSTINIFLIFFSLFFTFSILSRQFSRENLLFFLSKPLSRLELLLGVSLGLMIIFLLYWLFLSLEVGVIISLFDKSYLFSALSALLPIILLIPLYTSLCIFFFSVWPNVLCAIFPFLFIFTSFAKFDIINFVSQANLAWLKKLIEASFLLLPPVGQIMGISLKALGLTNAPINITQVVLNSIFIFIFLQILAARRISKAFSSL